MSTPPLSRKEARIADAAETFDVIVVGAGSAGCAVAARLSEDPATRVLLLEAGGTDKRQEVTIPAAFSKLFKSDVDWNYQTTAQPGLAGRSIYWPRGKMLGGSSSMNAMMWVTGFAADYERWSELAGPNWGWDAMRPLLESTAITVEDQRDPRPLTADLLRAAREAGYALEEANRPAPDGFTQTRVTQHNGSRWNAVRGYLDPAKDRPNLVVRTDTHVDRVVFDGTRAVGVEYLVGRERRTVRAAREIVLAAGAIGTPAILVRSGIGPAKQLQSLGIPVVAASADVGRQLRDHLASLLAKEAPGGGTLFDAESLPQIAKYLFAKKGMLTSNVAEMYGFVRSDPALDAPDLEILAAPAAYVDEGLTGIPGHGLSIGPVLLQPRSRGSITVTSTDPLAAPVIEPNYLSDPDGVDRATLRRGLEIAQSMFDTAIMRERTNERYIAPRGGERLGADERIDASLEHLSHTLYHPTSTARMGNDAGSVVDPELRVRGVSGLRVADASVMPEIIRGHTHAPTVAIGENAARLIRQGTSREQVSAAR
ncbi:GMC family oxidoreductase N-terminal domain-containing protein [uncultured Microbacterium sp.]|uniref:GMC family oxidoreductase n=1 Tax=uncultured Microbacterium sp. TaxID=191216 RepID=UPI0025FED56B|nr:GMC family oxidoreductase N-terminal domain-containing protein [uncultured Microbacterium sp.]